MIITASRRTDIPAFYADWFMHRLRAGYALVPNPRNPQRISRVSLSPQVVDCIVFWTKNPGPMLAHFGKLKKMGYAFMVHYTLTPYGKDVEPGLPHKGQLVKIFVELAQCHGAERMVWRYDPVVIDGRFSLAWHAEKFERMCQLLQGHAQRCIISFVDPYKSIAKLYRAVTQEEMHAVAQHFSRIAACYGLRLYTCAEAVDLSPWGIEHGACVDKKHLEELTGSQLTMKKDTNQREECLCAETVDVGAYDTCPHGCSYCYAVSHRAVPVRHLAAHDPQAPMITGYPTGQEIITDRTKASYKSRQLSLLSCATGSPTK